MGSHRSAVVASGVLLAVLTVAACSPGESGPTVGVTTAVSTTRTLPTPAPPIAPLPADGPASVGGVALPGLLLVPVQRPADALSALGWLGATNYDMTGADLSAVLRSWEDRFGATLMAVGYDTIDLHVTRPPIDAHDHRALAKEHTLFDPDLLSNLTFSEYAEAIETTDVWSFWWD